MSSRFVPTEELGVSLRIINRKSASASASASASQPLLPPALATTHQLPRLDQMPQRQHQSQEDAQSSDGDVGDSEEGVPTADEGDGGEDEGFRTAVGLDWVVCFISRVGGSARGKGEGKREKGRRKGERGQPTHINLNLILAGAHRLVIIPKVQLPKSGQPSRSHPHLKVFIHTQIGDGVLLGITIWIAIGPVGRRHCLRREVGGFGVFLGFPRPGYPLGGHVVGDVARGARGVDQDGGEEGVCEFKAGHRVSVGASERRRGDREDSPLKTELAINPQGKMGMSPMTANGLHSPPEMSEAVLAAPLSWSESIDLT